jgi:chemotaxis protein methyltransferase WspC
MSRIESLLRKEIGLDAASIGSTLIERTVRLRMKALGLKQVEDYERLLLSSRAAMDALIEAVVVTETWFFRDHEPFAAFAEMALQWLPKHPAGTLRALSIPCSSGEEPYSLAMTLLDVAVPPHRFVIDAVDISSHALARARHAVYGKNSFRGKDLAFRDRYFRHAKEGYLLIPAARQCVHFHRDNLLGEEFLAGAALYDCIFCRNLLIYFDRATQVKALERIHRLLTPEGMLFVGPAELPLVAGNGFTSANLPMAFACRKTEVRSARRSPQRLQRISPAQAYRAAFPAARANAEAAPAARTSPRQQSAVRAASAVPSDLDAARQLADAGRTEEAAAICEAHLRSEGPSAEVYYLLGLLHDASGDPKASDFYRKALYLEPNHYETLLHLSLLLERKGDPASRNEARTFKRRAERVQPQPARAGRN